MGIPGPEIDDVNRWYWEGLVAGELCYQRCRRCRNAWLPPAEECSRCLEADWAVERASGKAELVSWVRYHTTPHPGFADKLPYNVAVVELAEGPRTVTNLTGIRDWEALRQAAPLVLQIEVVDGVHLARFALADG